MRVYIFVNDTTVQTIGEIVSEIRNYTKDDSEATIMSIIFNVLMLFVKPRDEAERTMMENKREKLRNQFINLLNQDGILVFPALSTPAPFHHQHHFTPFNIAYTQLFNILGLPAVVCPVGLNKDGIPTSVQLVGGPYSEGLLMAACQELEKGGVTGWVQPGAV